MLGGHDNESFLNFVRAHLGAIGQVAVNGYTRYGRGVVLINVAGLRGGKKFRVDQGELPLVYRPLTAVHEESRMNGGQDDRLVEMARRYAPDRQAVVAAMHRDGINETAYIGVVAPQPVGAA